MEIGFSPEKACGKQKAKAAPETKVGGGNTVAVGKAPTTTTMIMKTSTNCKRAQQWHKGMWSGLTEGVVVGHWAVKGGGECSALWVVRGAWQMQLEAMLLATRKRM